MTKTRATPHRLSRVTVALLGEHLPQEAVLGLVTIPERLAEGRIARPLTRRKAHALALRTRSAAHELAHLVDELMGWNYPLFLNDRSLRALQHPTGAAGKRSHGFNPVDMVDRLRALAASLSTLVEATAPGAPTQRRPFPGEGLRCDVDARPRLVAGSVVCTFYAYGKAVTTGETGPVVRCVAAMFADLGFTADAREAVRSACNAYPFLRRRGATSVIAR